MENSTPDAYSTIIREDNENIIKNYTICDDHKAASKVNRKIIMPINHGKMFDLIRVNDPSENSIIYFDININRYTYMILSKYQMRIIGSLSNSKCPFECLIDDLEKYRHHNVKIVYPRKEIFKKYGYARFLSLWDSFYFVEPDHKEKFLRGHVQWNCENPFFQIDKKFGPKDIKHLKKGTKVNAHKKSKSFFIKEREFKIDEILV